MILRPFFSFYGAKWRGSLYYPKPLHKTIIEPFAGSAGYSLRYFEHDVILNDIDPTISNIWKWLIEQGDVEKAPEDLKGFWYNKGSSAPAKSPSAWMRSLKWPSQFWGDKIKERIKQQMPLIKHWKISNKSYLDLENIEATWFIDPPYKDKGLHYKFNSNQIDFNQLSNWCKTRKGQVIVCEQSGADWLPFKPFKHLKSLKSLTSKEVLYENCLGTL